MAQLLVCCHEWPNVVNIAGAVNAQSAESANSGRDRSHGAIRSICAHGACDIPHFRGIDGFPELAAARAVLIEFGNGESG
jgi:hypothetical protein